jgi:hypothetical protein
MGHAITIGTDLLTFSSRRSNFAWMITYSSVLTLYAAANVAINYLAKGSTWDIYPAAEAIWLVLSIVPDLAFSKPWEATDPVRLVHLMEQPPYSGAPDSEGKKLT